LGALFVLIFAWLGWRARGGSVANGPFSHVFSGLIILGRLLLLGHAHSNFAGTGELTNLINVQHAVMGGLGRPPSPSQHAAPANRLLMAFCYREAV